MNPRGCAPRHRPQPSRCLRVGSTRLCAAMHQPRDQGGMPAPYRCLQRPRIRAHQLRSFRRQRFHGLPTRRDCALRARRPFPAHLRWRPRHGATAAHTTARARFKARQLPRPTLRASLYQGWHPQPAVFCKLPGAVVARCAASASAFTPLLAPKPTHAEARAAAAAAGRCECLPRGGGGTQCACCRPLAAAAPAPACPDHAEKATNAAPAPAASTWSANFDIQAVQQLVCCIFMSSARSGSTPRASDLNKRTAATWPCAAAWSSALCPRSSSTLSAEARRIGRWSDSSAYCISARRPWALFSTLNITLLLKADSGGRAMRCCAAPRSSCERKQLLSC